MKNILVPIGTNPRSHETLQYAVDFASEFSATIYAMEVFNVSAKAGSLANISEKVAESSKARLREIVDKIDTKNSPIKIATYNGELVDGLRDIDKELGIDLIVISSKSNDISDSLYLGNVTGSIVKKTKIPTLIVPKDCVFKPYDTILMAFKSGVLKRKKRLSPLIAIQEKFKAQINMLLVKTPGYTDEDLEVDAALMDLSSHLTTTENATTYQGVLEHFQSQQPDLLCVFRSKRGFFKKLWEKNSILKSEFFVKIPVLVLRARKD